MRTLGFRVRYYTVTKKRKKGEKRGNVDIPGDCSLYILISINTERVPDLAKVQVNSQVDWNDVGEEYYKAHKVLVPETVSLKRVLRAGVSSSPAVSRDILNFNKNMRQFGFAHEI